MKEMSWAEHDVASLEEMLRRWGVNASHATRLLRRFYRSHGELPANMPGLPMGLMERLAAEVPASRSRELARTVSADGTTKLLLALHDGAAVETVLMPDYRAGRAAGCVSSQVGCAMACDFCATGKAGLVRNLSAGEIVDQYLALRRAAALLDRRVTSLVFMGMGEPMHNLPNVVAAIGRIGADDLGALSRRQITVSTVGIVPGIDALAAADLNVHLALSLHAPDDATRARLVPANRRYPVAAIVDAARRFYDRTGRIVTIEYCLLADVNDSDADAAALATLLDGFRTHVNIIPYNPIGSTISGTNYRRPAAERVTTFLEKLRGRGMAAHIRRTRGDDASAACGQLREIRAKPGRLPVVANV